MQLGLNAVFFLIAVNGMNNKTIIYKFASQHVSLFFFKKDFKNRIDHEKQGNFV